MPQFIFVELPSFRIKNASGHTVRLNYDQLGLVGALYQYLARMRTDEPGVVVASSADVPVGQAYYLIRDSPWYAINGQEGMTDAQIAEAISRQGVLPTYWIGR
ncbi:hypothetical protein K449DRAFT_427108 [Hypoxylon sp. EC38]|nr:hypothetical protein K449DRAFT_427108 [Hypoxylon sp. EC38]